EAVHKELGDSLVRATTTASSLEAEYDSGNINKTQSKATPNESSSLGTTSGGGPRGNTLQSDEDRLKHDELMGRIDVIDVDEEITLVSVHDVNVSTGEEVFVAEQEVADNKENDEVNVVEEVVKVINTAKLITNATAVVAATTTTAIITTDKGKRILIKPVKPIKKKDLIGLDEETALNLQAKFNEEERLARDKAKKEEANIALIETWDDIQAKIDVDHQLAKRLQAQE
ncbi:hypothetical protein Tco_1534983, partial [Tanacetum coccineum]